MQASALAPAAKRICAVDVIEMSSSRSRIYLYHRESRLSRYIGSIAVDMACPAHPVGRTILFPPIRGAMLQRLWMQGGAKVIRAIAMRPAIIAMVVLALGAGAIPDRP